MNQREDSMGALGASASGRTGVEVRCAGTTTPGPAALRLRRIDSRPEPPERPKGS